MTTTELLAKKYAEIFSKEYDSIKTECIGNPRNINGNEYNGCNIFFLEKYSRLKGFKLPVFMTFNQAKAQHLAIQKGAQSCPVVYYECTYIHENTGKRISQDEYEKLSEDDRKSYTSRTTIKYFNVFNIEQTDVMESSPKLYSSLMEDGLLKAESGKKKRDAIIFSIDRNIDKVMSCYPDKDLFDDKHDWYKQIFRIVAQSDKHENELSPIIASSIVMTKVGLSNTLDKHDKTYMKYISKSPLDAFNAVTEAARLANNVLRTFNINY